MEARARLRHRMGIWGFIDAVQSRINPVAAAEKTAARRKEFEDMKARQRQERAEALALIKQTRDLELEALKERHADQRTTRTSTAISASTPSRSACSPSTKNGGARSKRNSAAGTGQTRPNAHDKRLALPATRTEPLHQTGCRSAPTFGKRTHAGVVALPHRHCAFPSCCLEVRAEAVRRSVGIALSRPHRRAPAVLLALHRAEPSIAADHPAVIAAAALALEIQTLYEAV